MITPVFAAESGGSRVFKIGRVGLDTGTTDTGGFYTATLKTERISPMGENTLLMFRRVACRVWRTGGFTTTMTVYVDGVQTKIYDTTGALVPQSVIFVAPPPSVSPIESWIESSIQAPGTYIEVQLSVRSDQLTAIFLPAEIEVHFYPIRTAKERAAQSK